MVDTKRSELLWASACSAVQLKSQEDLKKDDRVRTGDMTAVAPHLLNSGVYFQSRSPFTRIKIILLLQSSLLLSPSGFLCLQSSHHSNEIESGFFGRWC